MTNNARNTLEAVVDELEEMMVNDADELNSIEFVETYRDLVADEYDNIDNNDEYTLELHGQIITLLDERLEALHDIYDVNDEYDYDEEEDDGWEAEEEYDGEWEEYDIEEEEEFDECECCEQCDCECCQQGCCGDQCCHFVFEINGYEIHDYEEM